MKASVSLLLLLALVGSCAAEDEASGSVVYTESDLEIYQMHIRSDITFRFSTTLVYCRLENRADESREFNFFVVLPESAFISNFSMVIDAELYYGKVKPRNVAKREYQAAKARGESAAKISQEALNSNEFMVSVNVASLSKVDFNLTYQELLQRRMGLYEHLININPGQTVRDLRVDVFIQESRPITKLRVPPMRQIVNTFQLTQVGENPLATVQRISPTEAAVSYVPSLDDQVADAASGVNGQFIIQYDVQRELDIGEVQVINGYFVHFFAPSGLKPVEKDIIFIIDVSGSMGGEKIRQTRESMLTILDDLRPGDRFSIVTFDHSVYYWPGFEENLLVATESNVERAKAYVRTIRDMGGTNINSAIVDGMTYLLDKTSGSGRPRLAVFLTDGNPTSGVTDHDTILYNVREANKGRVNLFTLGFGSYLDFSLLRRISLQNNGFARKIYLGSDAPIQLEGFYDEISTPVLSEVKLNYLGDSVDEDSLTNTDFSTLFEGTEIIVAGKLRSNLSSLPLEVSGGSADGNLSFSVDIAVNEAERRAQELNLLRFTERLWAYLTIRRLLDTMLGSPNSDEREEAERRATAMSLEYGFVTPLTSMVVTKPRRPRNNNNRPRPSQQQRRNQQQQQQSSSSSSSLPSSLDAPPSSSLSWADNDPHFIVRVAGIGEGLCFDVNAPPGSMFQLVYDRVTGISVNAEIVASAAYDPTIGNTKTYLGQILLRHRGQIVHVTTTTVTVNKRVYRWANHRQVDGKGLLVTITAKKYVDVTFNGNVTFRILRHVYKRPVRQQVDYLGFYIHKGRGLSRWTHGVIGQFTHQSAKVLNTPKLDVKSGTYAAQLRLAGPNSGHRFIKAHLGQRRNMDEESHVSCWYVRGNGRGLLEGLLNNYRVAHLDHHGYSVGVARLKKTQHEDMALGD